MKITKNESYAFFNAFREAIDIVDLNVLSLYQISPVIYNFKSNKFKFYSGEYEHVKNNFILLIFSNIWEIYENIKQD